MPLEVAVVKRPPTAIEFWNAMMRIVPRSLEGTARRMAAAAPRGKTGKLGRRVDVRIVRINQGFVQGVEADFVVGVPYGHLVTRGHQIIARGAQRKGLKLSKADRKVRRTALLSRRSAGAIGRVPGNPFADQAFAQDRGAIITTIERLLAQESGQ